MLQRHIRYFQAVAKHLSFTRAAAELHVSQLALSQQLKQLEVELGIQLFDRVGRTICLTDNGYAYLECIRRISPELQEVTRDIHDVKSSGQETLRLAVTPTLATYFIGPLVEEFHSRYPKITLNVQEISQETIEKLLLEGVLDIGVAVNEANCQNIEVMPLMKEMLALVVNREHPIAKKKSVGSQALKNESLVLLSKDSATREQIDNYLRENGIQPKILVETNTPGAVIDIVRRTSLSTLLPARTALAQDNLIAIALKPELMMPATVLMCRKDAYQSLTVRAFTALALEISIQLKV